jgi:Flp pilus assembly protein TadG
MKNWIDAMTFASGKEKRRSPFLTGRAGAPLCRLRKEKNGNVAIVFAMFSVPALALIGCSIDFARAHAVKTRLQFAIDAAVLAGRNEAIAAQISTATAYFEGNSLRQQGTDITSSFSLSTDGSLSGAATADVKTIFAGIMNIPSIPVRVAAQATADVTETTTTTTMTTQTVKVPGYTPCIHVMSQSADPAWKMISNSGFNASSCVARVRSNGSTAFMSQSSSNVKFKKILVKGGAGVVSGGITIIDAPNKIATNSTLDVTGDPFDSSISRIRSLIEVGNCTASNTGKNYSSGTVVPGTYCGVTTFDGVTFGKGLYIIASGKGNGANGSLSIKGKINGSAGVTFYFADNKAQLLNYAAAEGSTLRAPSAGITQGLLMFEDSNRGNAYDFKMSGVNKQSWSGVVYLPSINMTLSSLSEWTSMNISLTVNTLTMDSLSSIVMPYSWTPFGSTAPITFGETTTTTTVPMAVTTTTTIPGHLKN